MLKKSIASYSLQCTAAGEPLVLTGVDLEGMDLLIDWVCATFKQGIAYEQRLALFHASHKFHIRELQSECERELKSSISLQTYPLLADLARKFNCQELEQVGFQHPFLVYVNCSSACTHESKAAYSGCHKERPQLHVAIPQSIAHSHNSLTLNLMLKHPQTSLVRNRLADRVE